MRNMFLALVLLTVSPSMLASDRPTTQPVLGPFAMAVLVIPVALVGLGYFWQTVCEGTGNQFYINEQNDWVCSGLPRRPR